MSNLYKLPILVSYAYMKDDIVNLLLNGQDKINFLLDSGAYTAFTLGKTIKIKEYCQYIKQFPLKNFRYMALDVIGNHAETEKNYQYMLDQGLKPIAVFQRGDEVARLEKYYETTDYVAIGGLVSTKNKDKYVSYIMKYIAGRQVHWLGFVKGKYIKHFKPTSCDSSNWTFASRKGSLRLYRGNGKPMFRALYKELPSLKLSDWKIIESYGFECKQLYGRENWHGHKITENINACSHMHASYDIFKNTGTLSYLVGCSKGEVSKLFNEYQRLKDHKIIK